jgi:hypothetical protein
MIQSGEDGGIIPMIDMSGVYDEASSVSALSPTSTDTAQEG